MQYGKQYAIPEPSRMLIVFRRLCIQIPRAGGRLLEWSDQELLKLDFGEGARSKDTKPSTSDSTAEATM
jgi:hypothetical protein